MKVHNYPQKIFRRYFEYMYCYKYIKINKVSINRIEKNEKRQSTSNSLKTKIGLILTYTMTFLFVADFIVIVTYLFVYPTNNIPSILHDLFIALLGYFGGTFVAFMKAIE